MDRETFEKEFLHIVIPILRQAYERRGNKVQHLYLDTASIHYDKRWHTLEAAVKPHTQIHYLPASYHHLISPLDSHLFSKFDKAFRTQQNATAAEVRAAAEYAAGTISQEEVSRAIKAIGFYVSQLATATSWKFL